MADPSSYRPKPGQIPDSPGVYKFRDEHRRVIYVGKAKSLRQRLANYFQDLASLHPRTRTMVTTAASVEWTVVSTEVEALQLEYSWIKEFDPRFNVKYRDDKSYPYLAVTMNEEFPRVQVMRGAQEEGRALLRSVRRTPGRSARPSTCCCGSSRSAPAPPASSRTPPSTGRPCLLGYIGKCSAPCVGRVTAEEHRELAEEFCDFMAGRTGTYLRRLEQQMTEAAEEMEYERAARLRDDIEALQAGHGEERRRARRRHRRRPDRRRRGRAGGRRPDLPRPRRPGARPARLGHRQGRGRRHRAASSSTPSSSCTARRRATPSPRRSSSRPCPSPPKPVSRVARRAPRLAVSPAHPAARRQEGPDGDRRSATPSRRSSCTRPSAPPT